MPDTLAPKAPRLTLADAEAEITRSIHRATELFEQLERTGVFCSNADFIRKQLVKQALDALHRGWVGTG